MVLIPSLQVDWLPPVWLSARRSTSVTQSARLRPAEQPPSWSARQAKFPPFRFTGHWPR